MTFPVDWPGAVVAHLQDTHGSPTAVERLGGMSVASVWRAQFVAGSAVVKSSPRPAESRFYRTIAPGLRDAGVPVVRVECLAGFARRYWIIMEDVPGALPVPSADQWRPDPRVVSSLVTLHAATRGASFELDVGPLRWQPGATEAALEPLPAHVRERIQGPLHAMQPLAAKLEEPWCWISGDPSPPNWGVRPDGSVAHFDWELFRPGTPAGDLAPVVPGLLEPSAFRRAADAYLEAASKQQLDVPWQPAELAKDIAVAKAAAVVMLLRAHATGAARVPEAYVSALLDALPGWLERTCAAVGIAVSSALRTTQQE